MKYPIAIVFSDLHINDWKKYNLDNSRTLNHLRVLFDIKDLCYKYKCPAIFCGDLLHKPENISQELLDIIQFKFDELDNFKEFICYSISGNHDINSINSLDNLKTSWVKIFSQYHSWLKCVDLKTFNLGEYKVLGIPYIDHNQGITEYIRRYLVENMGCKNILLLHTVYPGAKDTDGRLIDVDDSIKISPKLLSKFDLVLCGHIHKPQQLNHNTYMIGAPIQQRRTDKDCKLGYWILYSDLSLRFKSLKGYPRFIDVESDNQVDPTDGNYYTIIPPIVEESENTSNEGDTRILSQRKMVSKYLREQGLSKDRVKRKLLLSILKEASNED